ncbi:MAG: helix-turn-helix domain-containing protein [Clostridia bacterium]|nr:helix-turn-helix domain-containing protein [Clostridia bacterium]
MIDNQMLKRKTVTVKPDPKSFFLHTHECYEIYCFLKGGAKYLIEGNIYNLKPGDILLIKKHEAHMLILTKDYVPYERIVVHFDMDSVLGETANKFLTFINKKEFGKDNCYRFSDYGDTHLSYFLEKACYSKDGNQRNLYLTVFLDELCGLSPSKEQTDQNKDNLPEIIKYINHHLTENITLEKICEKFFISKPHLIRKFKNMTGVTVWSYIRSKRLLLAKEQLQNGGQPTQVAISCGFNDYCSFFKAYKNTFGVSPKEDYKKV